MLGASFFQKRAALAIALVTFLVALWQLPHRVCARDARDWYEGSAELQHSLARSVARWVDKSSSDSFATGSERFDGEWLFGTHMMASMGFGQVALEHPNLREEMVRHMDAALDASLSPAARRFDRAAWGTDALESLESAEGHAAYLGYTNLALSLHRVLVPESRFARLNDAVTETLVRRLERSRRGLLETYPDEAYPVDNAAVVASIALHGRATGTDRTPLIKKWSERARRRWVDSKTGLLVQSVSPRTGKPVDAPRGSGTALAAYFLAFADSQLAGELHEALERQLRSNLLGFGVLSEYADGGARSGGDIDSGPLIAGYSMSATGFAISSCRSHGNFDCFRRTYALVHLMGAPTDVGDVRTFVSGGPLADSIMFAMLTAPRAGALAS